MRSIIVIAALLVAAACSPAPSDNASDPPIPPGALAKPTPRATPVEARFVGDWAATPALCEGGRWRFRKGSLSTAGEVSCGFSKIEEVAGGYDVLAVCSAEGASAPETIKLRVPEMGGPMTVQSKTFQPITLSRCAGK